MRTVQADWRYLNRDVHGEFDAIICLGNSFTHMFHERDRRKAMLAELEAEEVPPIEQPTPPGSPPA